MIITPKTSIVNIVSHKNMRYLFQNAHKSRKTVHDLLDSRRNAIDILFIQEAPINFVRKVPSATNPEGDDLIGPVIHKAWTCVDRRLAFPDSAVAIYVNKRLTSAYQLFPVEKADIHQDVLFVHLKHNFLRGHDFTVCNVYNRPGARNAAATSFMNALPLFTDLAIVEGDFNRCTIASLSLTTTIPPHFRHFRPSLPSAIHPFLVPTTLSSVPPVEPWLQAIPGRLCGVNRPPRRQNPLPGPPRP